MKAKLHYIIPFILFGLITLLLWRGLHHDPHQLQSALINKSIPEFTYSNLLDPNNKITRQTLIGHVSLLNVWATWCITCHAEHSVLMDITQTNKVKIYGLNYKDEANSAKNWLTKYGNPYSQIIFDPQGTLAIDLGVYGTPETFIIDRQGIIRYRHIGAISPEDWKEKIEPLVRKWINAS